MKHKQTDHFIHTVTGLLNFLGGSFEVGDLEKLSFAEVSDHIIRNGGKIGVGVQQDNNKEFCREEL